MNFLNRWSVLSCSTGCNQPNQPSMDPGMRRCWDDPSYNVYGHALEGAVGGGQWQPLLVHVDHPVQKVNTKDFEWKHDFRAWKGRGERRRLGWRRGCHIVQATVESRWKLTLYTWLYWALQDDLLLEPYSHILSVPGKNIRGKLIRYKILGAYLQFVAIVATFFLLAIFFGPWAGGSTAGWRLKRASWKQLGRLFRCFTMQGFFTYPQLPQLHNSSMSC